MVIETKYALEQEVFFMKDNKICSALIQKVSTSSYKNKTIVTYNIDFNNREEHLSEDELFSNIDELIVNLSDNIQKKEVKIKTGTSSW